MENWIPASRAGMTPLLGSFSHKYLRNLPSEKKGKRSPVVRVLTLYYCKWRCNNVLTLSLSAV
ncbi:hypothetical protein, partial [Wolbachia pipientis]|uniref:hypothetical protein n=1 Tax=Wolbachia pipientis TaxID=955 RepID=UPI001C9DFB39